MDDNLMGLIINWLPKPQGEVITMGKQPVADYYPPGATEPIVRPDNVPAEPEPEGVITGDEKTAPVKKEPAKEPTKAPAKKK
jgi:hypothetical protein